MSTATISVIIPTLNEAAALPATLAEVCAMPALSECFVVDGGSEDATKAVVARFPEVRWLQCAPGRGRQMNVGARAATGTLLLFHHADTSLPADAETLLLAAARDPSAKWGGFHHHFSESNWKLRLISRLHNWRWHKTGVVYGDQSMFVRRDFFDRLGGFREDTLEDLEFSDRALAHCAPHKLPAKVTTDSRKFRELGEFRALRHVLSILYRYERAQRLGNEAFFRDYR